MVQNIHDDPCFFAQYSQLTEELERPSILLLATHTG